MPNIPEIRSAARSRAPPPPVAGMHTDEGTKLKAPLGSRPTPSTFIWPLSKDVTAQVTFTGGDLKPSHLERLAKYLDLAKGALDAEEEDESL